MHNKQTLTFTGIGMLGAAVLLAGCGGGSLSTQNLGTRPSTIPYIYGIEPIAFYGAANAIGAQAAFEGSGFQDATSGQAYITGASGFSITTNPDKSTLPSVADPGGTGLLPFGFSTSGLYADAQNQIGAKAVTVTSMAPGTSVYFRAAIANGVATNNTSPAITGATLTSTDTSLASVAGLTAGLPLTFPTGTPVGGAFSNATYVTGTGGTATPFTIPASTTTGLHTVTCAVTDSAGRVTATTFGFPVLAATDAAVLARIVGTVPAGSPVTYAATVVSATATISSPIASAVAQTTADADQNVFLFAAPGAQTITATATVVITTATGATVSTLTQTGTLPVTTTAGGTISNAVVTVAGTTPAPTGSVRSRILHHK